MYIVNAETGFKDGRAVVRHIKFIKDLSVLRKTAENVGMSLSVAWLQIFSDKSQVSFFAVAMRFCPFHMPLLRFSQERRRRLIPRERNKVVYLPVTIEASPSNPLLDLSMNFKTQRLSKW